MTSMARAFWPSARVRRNPSVVQLAQAALPGLALVDDQVEARRASLPMTAREQGVRLAAVVGLVIEEMIERGGEHLLDIGRVAEVR